MNDEGVVVWWKYIIFESFTFFTQSWSQLWSSSVLLVSVFSSVQRFENMLNNFRINTNPKQDAEMAPPRLQEEPWLISDQDLERNKSKVWYWGEKRF